MVESHDGPRAAGPGLPGETVPQGLGVANATGGEQIADALNAPQQHVPVRQILPILLAQFTMCVAAITPTAYSLAVWMQRIAPESKDAVLPLAIGIPATLVIFLGPIINVLSDRTRSRLGRRRTWLLAGTIAGTLGMLLVVAVPSVITVVIGWAVALVGYTAVSSMILVHFSDRLPESQRGRVMGIAGAVTQIGPLAGVVLAGAVSSVPPMIFLVPAAASLIGSGLLIAVMKDPQHTGERPPLNLGRLFQGFWFNPRRHPNVGWVWLNKIFIYLALSFMTVYSVYLLSSRMGLEASGIAGVMSLAGVIGAATGVLGALGSGVLSDRLGVRKPFLVVSAVILAGGLVVIGTAGTVTQYLIGTACTAGAAGVYGAVDQALQLDVLPTDEDQNGRYLAVLGLGQQIPQAIGPLLAGVVLAVAGGEYGWVYFVAAGSAIVSIFAVLPIRLSANRDVDVPVAAPVG